ncbi:hypothetical protein [Winogradskyella sp. SM1960]|uniref:hypothetical protein n=1 Tax=Winogradskyella sp. SM1960 TaxID=2865955 RepID=UPI001CD274E0|nr:hypothetical protein [Winogradskyella sp. SM1960]
MKRKHIILILVALFIGTPTNAQLLKKLKKKAEQAAERTILKKTDQIVTKKTEKTIDDATTKKSKTKTEKSTDTEATPANSALNKHTQEKTEFYKDDLEIKLLENGTLNQTQYFDADEVAVRLEQDDMPKPGYIDSEGFMYTYKDGEYTKSSLIALQSQGMMVPTMLLNAYKLPPEPFMAQFQKQTDKGITANPFNGIVEFAFIYQPEDFRFEDFKETTQTLRGETYTKFEFLNEPGYEGSYVLFDDTNRLVEIYTKVNNSQQNFEIGDMPRENGESALIYNYTPVTVALPQAREVRAQGQGLMEGVMGNIVKGGNQPKGDIDNDDYDTSDSKGQVKSVKKALKNHKVTAEMLPDTYDFDYIYKTTMVQNSKKSDAMDMNFLINTKTANYNGAEYIFNDKNSEGNSIMIFDLDLQAMIMLMNYGTQKMLQIHPIPEVKNHKNEVDFTIKELPSKSILGYKCMGLQIENDKYILKAYHAKNAPITLSNFFGFSGNKASKGLEFPNMDPKFIQQFENSLIMEMQYEDKKRKKNNFVITAKSLEKQPYNIKTKEYQSLNMFSGSKLLNKN